MIGATIGALIVMPFSLNPENGANFFESTWVALGLTVFAFLLVTFVIVPPENVKKEQIDGWKETPIIARKILVIAVIASALDSAGDEGTRMARGTIMSAVFPEWSTVARQNILLIAMIGVVMISMCLIFAFKPYLSLPVMAVFGCAFTLATQLILMVEWTAGPYLIFWHLGKLFGFVSTICSGFIIQAVAPKIVLGYWNGRNEALTNAAAGVAPLIFATIYDAIGSARGQQMLACTSAVSLLATLSYAPLICLMT